MNKVILIGRVGGDAELKTFGERQAATFSLATSETYKAKDGSRQERTEWHRCTLWGPRAEKVWMYITKGKMLSVEGSIRYRETEKDGVKGRYTDIDVSDIGFLSSGEQQQKPQQQPAPKAESPYKVSEQPFNNPATQSDLPF